ncbi:hypothetical protein CsSME_00010098 [Camellia sinensis var. sinensis]
MKIQSWNIRGIDRPEKIRKIKKSILERKVDIILIQETKKSEVNIGLIRSKWPGDQFEFMAVDAVGRAGGLLCIWNPEGILTKLGIYPRELGVPARIEE